MWKCKIRLLLLLLFHVTTFVLLTEKETVELWNMPHFLNFSDVVIAWCFWVFDVAEKLWHLFYISLWSGSSYAASWYATPLLWQCQLWSQCDTAAALRIILILLVYLLCLMSFELTWSIQKWRLESIFSQISGCFNYFEFTFCDGCICIGTFLHEMKINNQVNDFMNYVLCTTREHQSMLYLWLHLVCIWSFFQHGFGGLWDSLYEYIKTNGGVKQ